jgi:hypothetical protein
VRYGKLQIDASLSEEKIYERYSKSFVLPLWYVGAKPVAVNDPCQVVYFLHVLNAKIYPE